MIIRAVRSLETKLLLKRGKRTHCSHCNRPLRYVWYVDHPSGKAQARLGAYWCTACDAPSHRPPTMH